MLDEITYMSV